MTIQDVISVQQQFADSSIELDIRVADINHSVQIIIHFRVRRSQNHWVAETWEGRGVTANLCTISTRLNINGSAVQRLVEVIFVFCLFIRSIRAAEAFGRINT